MRIGWIGLGVMGAPMAMHLLRAGHDVVVHTRTRAKAEELLNAGASWADSPAEAACGSDVACSMVGLPPEVQSVHLGPAGTLSASRLPKLLIDFSTSPRSFALQLSQEAVRRGVEALDAPVSGGDVGARNGTLSIMVGGSAGAFQSGAPVFAAFGKTVVHVGPSGAGQATKAVNQILVASSCVAMGEAFAYAQSAGLDLERVLQVVSAGAAGSWTLSNLGPRALRGDWNPGFMVDHLVKDLRIVLEEARQQGIKADFATFAERLYSTIQASGGGKDGTQAVVRHLLQAE